MAVKAAVVSRRGGLGGARLEGEDVRGPAAGWRAHGPEGADSAGWEAEAPPGPHGSGMCPGEA